MERQGPRAAAAVAAIFFTAGLVIGGFGLYIRQSALVFIGVGLIGGIGAELGYMAPLSTLVKWFPDRRGMATGMAIMGFGGGAFLAGFLNAFLVGRFGVARTLIALGVFYFAMMSIGARLIRGAPDGYRPAGGRPSKNRDPLLASVGLTRSQAIRTTQFFFVVVGAVHQCNGGHWNSSSTFAHGSAHVAKDRFGSGDSCMRWLREFVNL